jgi:hypothetical protein
MGTIRSLANLIGQGILSAPDRRLGTQPKE